jgi:hypothetical protein
MNTRQLCAFFLWCTVINGSLLILWVAVSALVPDFVYRTQSTFFPVPRESFDILMYGFLGLFKVFWLIFNLIPYVALRIVCRRNG